MNLLKDPWIPVRDRGGSGLFRLLRYEEMLCVDRDWRVSLPRDDLEMACIQMLVCLTQVLFIPESDNEWRARRKSPMSSTAFADGVSRYLDWFDLDHPTQPFMQTRGVKASEPTPIQKLLVGMPEGNNHAFFNKVGEARHLGPAVAVIALFNQASNSPSFGGGFKGGLRGGAPITTLVWGRTLREIVWRNVVTLDRVRKRLPSWSPGQTGDEPTWVRPIREKESIHSSEIGLLRGLFWQPAHVELLPADDEGVCDVIGGAAGPGFAEFNKAKFNFTVDSLWPHPHGVLVGSTKKGEMEWKFAAFTTSAPAWTRLTEFVVPQPAVKDAMEGTTPAEPVSQMADLLPMEPLHLLVGGYLANQAAIVERRHELMSLAAGWDKDAKHLKRLVQIGLDAKKALRGKLYLTAQGNKDKGIKGIGADIHEMGERLFYSRTESMFHETMATEATFKDRLASRKEFAERLAGICREIYEELTDPYCAKPELIAVIAWGRRSLNTDLAKLLEDSP